MDDKQAVKESVLLATDMIKLAGEYGLKAKKVGSSSMVCCPFHGEKTPSMNLRKNGWHCFGNCGEGGNAIDFVMKIENVDFITALKKLAARAGIDLPQEGRTEEEKAAAKQKAALSKIVSEAASFFHWVLTGTDQGAVGLEYLKSRSIGDEQIKTFQIGFAPRKGLSLVKHLERKKVDLALAVQAGVIRKDEQTGEYRDLFWDRVIFPIRDYRGRPIALSGRLVVKEGAGPKYINGPETPIFKKGTAFFGIDTALPAIKEKKAAIVVEGQMDRIRMASLGSLNTVASCGTALTLAHFRFLLQYTEKVVFLSDGDKAGRSAMFRGVSLAIEAGLTPEVVVLPEGEDPDSLVQKRGMMALRALQRHDGFDYVVEDALRGARDAVQKAKAVDKVIPFLGKYADPIARDVRIAEVAEKFGVKEDSIRKKMLLPDGGSDQLEVLQRAMVHFIKTVPNVRAMLKKRGRIDDMFDKAFLKEAEEALTTNP